MNMSAQQEELISTALTAIFYYIHLEIYQQAIEECDAILELESFQNMGKRQVFLFWKAFAKGASGCFEEMIDEMEHLRKHLQEDDLEFPISLAMLLFNKRAKNMNAKSVQVLTKNVLTMKKQANDNSLIIAASVYFHTHEFEEACNLLDFVVNNSARGLASLSYWIDVKSGTSRAIALKTISSTEDVGLILARAKYNSENGNFATAHDGLRDVLTKYNKFLPLLLEAAGIMMADKNWEEARSYLDRALELHPFNAQAIMMDILYDTLAGSDSIDLAKKSSELFNRFMEFSHPSASIFDKLSKMITNVLSVRCKECLDVALQCSNRAFREQPNNVDYLCQLALVNWLIDDVATAANLFNDALSIDRSNIECVVGSIRCLIYQGKFVEAKQQFELAEILFEDKTTSPHFQYLQTLLYDAKSRIEIKSFMDKQRFLYEQALSSCPVNGYVALDPRFLFELSQVELSKCMEHNIVMYKDSVCYFYNLILDSTINEEDKSGRITRFLDFLEILVEIYPASLEIVSVVARVHYSLGNICQSLASVKRALRYHPQDPRIHICMARLHLALGNYSIALQSLEMAVGVDFCVKDNVEFNLIKACCLIKSSKKIDEVRTSLDNFFYRSKLSSFSICSNWDSLSDQMHCRLLLANISNNFQTLQKYTCDSEYQFDSDFISLVMGEYMIKKKMYDEALRYFSNTSESGLLSNVALEKKALVYLECFSDKRKYIACFQDASKAGKGNIDNILSLINAFLNVDEVEKAIQCCEEALNDYPRESQLIMKLGQLLLDSEQEERALIHYENHLRNVPNDLLFRRDLISLYYQFRRDEALCLVQETLSLMKNRDRAGRWQHLETDSSLLLDIAKLLRSPDEDSLRRSVLFLTHSLQEELVNRRRSKLSREMIQGISMTCLSLFDLEKDPMYLSRALDVDPKNEMVIVKLANYHKSNRNISECRKYCAMVDSNCELNRILADILVEENKFDEAECILKTLHDQNKDDVVVLISYCRILYRNGKRNVLEELANSQEICAGSYFAKGLQLKYTGQYAKAVRVFNIARKDPSWVQESLINMIEIYLRTDELAECLFVRISRNDTEVVESLLDQLEALYTEPKNTIVLRLYYKMVNDLNCFEEVEEVLLSIVKDDNSSIPALLLLAKIYVLRCNNEKSRDLLKKIVNLPYNILFEKEIGQANLMLAKMYMENDGEHLYHAETLCNNCLKHNKSCTYAWFLLGIKREKEQRHSDAAQLFEKVWNLEARTNPKTGFKVAINLFYAKNFTKAIEFCDHILTLFPSYDIHQLFNQCVASLCP